MEKLPSLVTTVTGPVVAPAGTLTRILLIDRMVTEVTGTPLNVTEVTLKNPVPVMLTVVPTRPRSGLNFWMKGNTEKVVVLAEPLGPLTTIGPEVAVIGTLVVIWVGELTTKLAATPLKVTAVVPVKLAPLSTTSVLTIPLAGLKLPIVGPGMTVKLVVLLVVPPEVVMLRRPEVAPAGTVAVMLVSLFTTKLAGTPLKETAVAPRKLAPLSVTVVPATPVAGLNPATMGARVT